MSDENTQLSSTDNKLRADQPPPTCLPDNLIPRSHDRKRLEVRFHCEDGKVETFNLTYYQLKGIEGIHDMVRRKAHSLGIDLGDEAYLIGEWDDWNKFRLITIDEDSFGFWIEYFKASKEAFITKTYCDQKRNYFLLAVSIPLTIVLSIIVMVSRSKS